MVHGHRRHDGELVGAGAALKAVDAGIAQGNLDMLEKANYKRKSTKHMNNLPEAC